MKCTFDNSTKLVAVLPFLLLVVSTVHDWGYFLVIGPKLRSIQTTYDYVTNALDWLPLVALVGAGLWVESNLSICSFGRSVNLALGIKGASIIERR
jgi:hypothetical protein